MGAPHGALRVFIPATCNMSPTSSSPPTPEPSSITPTSAAPKIAVSEISYERYDNSREPTLLPAIRSLI